MKGHHMQQNDECFEMIALLYLTPRGIELMMGDGSSRLQTKFSSACEILEVFHVTPNWAHSRIVHIRSASDLSKVLEVTPMQASPSYVLATCWRQWKDSFVAKDSWLADLWVVLMDVV
jgi:hypothetical protein